MLGIDLGTDRATGVWLSAGGAILAASHADPRDLLGEGSAGAALGLLRGMEAVIAIPFDASAEHRALAGRAGRTAGMEILGVLQEPVAAALGRIPAFREAPRPTVLLVVAPGEYASVVEWRGTSLTPVATARGTDILRLCDLLLGKVAVPWSMLADVVIVGEGATDAKSDVEARWGQPVVLPSDPVLAVAYGAAKVGIHLRQRSARTP